MAESMVGVTSPSLLARLNAQDAEAWRRFVHVYGPLVHAWCRKIGVTGEDAADVIQEVWTGVTTHLAGYERRAGHTFRAWLWKVTRHKLGDFLRRKEGRPPNATGGTTALERIQQLPEELPIDPSGVEHRSIVQRTLELIRPEFEEHTWKAFWMLAVDGRSAADAAEATGLKPNAVHQARFRVLKRLRTELEGLEET